MIQNCFAQVPFFCVGCSRDMVLCHPWPLIAFSLMGGECKEWLLAGWELWQRHVCLFSSGPEAIGLRGLRRESTPRKWNCEVEKEDNDIAYLHNTITLRTQVQHIPAQQLSKAQAQQIPKGDVWQYLNKDLFHFAVYFALGNITNLYDKNQTNHNNTHQSKLPEWETYKERASKCRLGSGISDDDLEPIFQFNPCFSYFLDKTFSTT